MKAKKALVLGLAVFLLALLAVLPARWIAGAVPEGIACQDWSGSIWNGQCRELSVHNGEQVVMKLASVRWKLKPLALLRLTLSAEFHSSWPQGEATGRIMAGSGGSIRLRGMSGSSALDRRFFGALPEGWQGRIDIRQLELDWRAGEFGRLGGELVVSDLVDGNGNALGGYRLQLQPGETPPFQGQLRDMGGPLQIESELQIAVNGSWELAGRMRARDPADTRLGRQLDLLATADLNGWRRLSMAGDFR